LAQDVAGTTLSRTVGRVSTQCHGAGGTMDAASLFGSANVHFVNEEYEEAVKHYTCAVTLQDCAEYRTCRAAAYLKVGKFAETVEDAAQALKFDPKSHMAFHWRGIALFYMGDFASAKLSFEESLRASPGAKAPRSLWLRKCDAELSGSTLPLGGVATEASKVAPPATAVAPAKVEPVVAPPSASSAPAAPVAEKSGITGRKQVRREWYQNNTHVMITLFVKGVDQDTLRAEFKAQELSVAFPMPGTSDEEYVLDLELFDAVEREGCKIDVSKVKVEISLAKKNVGYQWKDLEKAQMVVESTPDQPAYPTSNKQKRDWSAIDREIESEMKAEKPQGDEALNTLFKEIYGRADPETRRAMNKSFQTSGGTVLSTNWGEVAKADYEGKDRPTPPEGQDWRDTRDK